MADDKWCGLSVNLFNKYSFRIYPNPSANAIVTVRTSVLVKTIKVYLVLGNGLGSLENKNNSIEHTLVLSDLSI